MTLVENNLPSDASEIVGVDFFCGAGGITHGFLSAGIDILCGIDQDKTVQLTYEANNKRRCDTPCKFIHEDVNKLKEETLLAEIGDRNGKVLVFIGCAPCQPFTHMNTDRGKQGDTKSLLLSFFKHIESVMPEYVLVENVPGIKAEKYGNVFDTFMCGLKRLGYHTDDKVIDAKKYGVPQSRRRMAVIASLLAPIAVPPETHGKDKRPYVLSETAFRFPALEAGEECTTVPNHRAASLSELNLKRIRSITTPGGSRQEWPDELQLECYKEHDGHSDVYGRIAPERPAPTLTTKFHSLSNGRFGHPTQDRAITTREGAALQTFPDDYTFHACFYGNARHIGNAVPVLLAEVFARAIVEHYKAYLARLNNPKSADTSQQPANLWQVVGEEL